MEGNWKSASAHCAVTSRLSPGVSLRQQQRWRRSHRPRALPVVSLPATRQCHSSPCRAEHTVRYEPLTSQHRKASNVQLEPWPLTNIKPLHPPPILPSLILYPLCEFNISPQVKSQIGKQLHGPNKPRLDLSTDLFVMPCNQLREKVTSRSRACSEI